MKLEDEADDGGQEPNPGQTPSIRPSHRTHTYRASSCSATPPGRRDELPPPLPLACTARTATRGFVPGGGTYVFAFPGPAAVPSQLLEGYRDLQLPASGAREHASRAAPARPPGADQGPAGLYVLKAEDESDVLEKGNDDFPQASEEWEEAAVRDHEGA
ncbi:hypothetical protein BD309DRAFT_373897 [Dichomitus squalens]|uniref:Uncharacterized protein n=1 Tax=Dichomitus squalens TaxID=114155 RepID=A0A4Q9PIS2_9APHY|nr:hypothetical protein BD309DRAFT_373897 [Dichomitus squalens]TBU53961.1 hypothetical protein BD310DRAFT_113037 [Dichomitus squalens]